MLIDLDLIEAMIFQLPNYVFVKNKSLVYRLCNLNFAKVVGMNHPKEVIGKTDYDMPWGKYTADIYVTEDRMIIQTGKPMPNREVEMTTPDGERIISISKAPLFSQNSEIIGILGIYIDITEQKEAERIKLEDEINKKTIEQQEEVKKSLYKFIHDIQSPITSIMSMASTFELPEAERVALRNTARRASDLSNHLLMQYNKKNEDFSAAEESEAILVSCTLVEILTEKRYEYREQPISFDDAFKEYFVFMQVEPGAFKRMISNIINNAVGAFDSQDGKVIVSLQATAEWVTITIEDNGKGMLPATIQKIMDNTHFTEGKKDGHGIGYSQIHQTLKDNYGKINIHSAMGQGTTITLTFPREQAPSWSADAINLSKQDVVVILDDEASVIAAWQSRFVTALKNKADIQFKYFNNGHEALAFLNGLPPLEKSKVFLITDYELLNQGINGLNVIEQSNVERSILATSHYADKAIRARAIKMGTKILPKPLIPEIAIKINEPVEQISKTDLVFVDDDETFAKTIIRTLFRGMQVDYYSSSSHFLKQSTKYPKDVKICLDKNFAGGDMDGLILAKKLYEQGFSRIFLASGESLNQNELPEYITLVHKSEIENIKH